MRVLHAAQAPVHFKDAGRDVAADEEIAGGGEDGLHEAEQELDVLVGKTVGEHLFARGRGKREALDLVKGVAA